jgi:hypothetical protein
MTAVAPLLVYDPSFDEQPLARGQLELCHQVRLFTGRAFQNPVPLRKVSTK